MYSKKFFTVFGKYVELKMTKVKIFVILKSVSIISGHRETVMDFQVGDVIKMKKAHPCGANQWEITRVEWIFG